ncbi:3220_t:CDS:2, partial [Racocetra persica]
MTELESSVISIIRLFTRTFDWPQCKECTSSGTSCVFDASPKKRGPKRKLPLGNADLESNDPMHHKVRIQRNITMEILIQALDDPTKDLMIKLQDLFNMLVGAGLYNLESPTSSENEEGAALPLYVNAFYNVPTGNDQIDAIGSQNIEMSIKDVVDNFTNKIKEILSK